MSPVDESSSQALQTGKNEEKENEILQIARDNVSLIRQTDARIRVHNSAGEPVPDLEVEIRQKTQDFLFGNLTFDLVWGETYKADLFKQRFLELFNFAIFPFYWTMYERIPGLPHWAELMPALEWCRSNGVTPKGHPLVWPYSAGVPEWLYDMPAGSVETLIQARVLNIVQGFEPFIQTWDVTNEAVNHVSWEEATQPSFRSKYHEISMWRGIPVNGGFKREIPVAEAADWVEKSFLWAYAANPKATLIVNDYNQEIDPNIRQRFYDLVKELQRRGVPVSGVGLQVHPVDYWLWPHEIWDTLEMYTDLACPIHITELHQPAWEHEIEGGYRQGTWTTIDQADYVEHLYRLFFGHPSVVSINYWGLSDRNIWIQGAGLIDAEYKPKPAFTRLKKLIKGEWMTPTFTARTGPDGSLSFRGFYGKYDIVLKLPGRQHQVKEIHLAERTGNSWQVTMT